MSPDPPTQRTLADASPDSTARPSLVNRLADVIHAQPVVRSVALTGLFLIALAAVLYVARVVFIPLTIATMLSFVFRPAVRRLERLHIPAFAGAGVVIITLFAVTALCAVKLAAPAADWVERAPVAIRIAEERLQQFRRPVERANALAERVERIAQVDPTKKAGEMRMQQPGLLSLALRAGVDLLGGTFVVVFTLFFMLVSGDGLLARLVAFVPDLGTQQRAASVLREIEQRMSQYLATVSLINAALGFTVGLSVYLLHMPNPALWGVLAGLLHFVPYAGAAVGIGVLGLAAFVSLPTLGQAVLPPLLYLLFTAIEANLVSPFVLGRAFHLNPLVIFVWLVFWSWLWGIGGAVIAVPLLVLLKITCDQSDELTPLSELLKR